MLNTGKLAGRTIFISGASRGIGKAIALKCANDGANVVIAAKTAEPHPKLPGTIYTAAEEIEKAGGKCLPCIVDIRFEDQVQTAVENAVKKFGGIDVLVNNASAISLTGTLDTKMKTYDLMNGINARGTFLCSQKCLPYLKVGKNPHILNISPPLNLNPRWFRDHAAYTMAKYGMSMCALGMSEELKPDGIAVNALWPKTAIHTAAMEMLGGGKEIASFSRSPDIMADAAYVMLTKDSKSYTGNFAIDEDVLIEAGVTGIKEKYNLSQDTEPLPDYFLDDFIEHEKKQAATSDESSLSGVEGNVVDTFRQVESVLNEKVVKKVNGIIAFELSGAEAGEWYMDLKTGSGSIKQGKPASDPDCTFQMDSDNFIKIFKGEMKSTTAFMLGRMKIKGNLSIAMKLEKIMDSMRSKL
ncbi:hydroxysteroid dehydrogenase-like protein 2 [Tubulanus polymorphus]|uniref:hydroxysteroid dehydrogenase-like protein 2 n=1 Tax=Tubulanus polymorphus TaxID=672921 RepID=UPI003DA20142